MPRISDDRRADRRRQIAKAALRCFIRKGFEATSMADIIAESGLSAGAIYVHFENKQDLVTQVVRDVLEDRTIEFGELGRRDPRPHPGAVLREHLQAIVRNPDKAAIQLHLWSACAREPSLAALLEEFSAQMRLLFRDYLYAWLVQRGLSPQDAQLRATLLAPVVVGLRQGFVVQSALVPDFDADGFLEALDQIELAGSPT